MRLHHTAQIASCDDVLLLKSILALLVLLFFGNSFFSGNLNAQGQPTKEYIYLGGRLIATEEAASSSPSIASLTPSAGSIGTSVTIAGNNFGASKGSSTVTFNGTAAGTITSWSNTSIVVPVPTGSTTGNVVVTVGGVASNAVLFTVGTLPSITSLSPASGAPGISVTISGANFGATQGNSTVTFNGVTAPIPASSWSSTQIVVTVPTGVPTGSVPVLVTVNGLSSNSVNFSVGSAQPVISSISPTSGYPGTAVTITGNYFGTTQNPNGAVYLGGTAQQVTSWSNTQIVFNVLSTSPYGNASVQVSTSYGNSNTATFNVLQPYPDLVVTNVTWAICDVAYGHPYNCGSDNPLLHNGDIVTLKATIKNLGSAYSTGIGTGVKFSLEDGSYFTSDVINGSALGIYGTYQITVTPATGSPGTNVWIAKTGSHTITATVDYQHLEVESNENNNSNSTPCTVQVLTSDTTPPSRVNNMTLSSRTDHSMGITWGPATDNVGVVGYEIHRADISGIFSRQGTSPEISFTDYGLSPSSTYFYKTLAKDAGGNVSTQFSNFVQVITNDSAVSPSCSQVTILSGNGNPGYGEGTGTDAIWNQPESSVIAIDPVTNRKSIFICDTQNNRIRMVYLEGEPGKSVLIGGTGTAGYSEGSGNALNALYNKPEGIAAVTNTSGVVSYLLVTDRNHVIRKILPPTSTYWRSQFLSGTPGSAGDVNGSASTSKYNVPMGIVNAPNGYFYVVEWGNNDVRRVTSTGTSTTVLDVTTSTLAGGIAANSSSLLFVTQQDPQYFNGVSSINPASPSLVTLAGGPNGFYEGHLEPVDGIGTAARFHLPTYLTWTNDSEGEKLYIADSGFNAIRKMLLSNNNVTTLVGKMTGTCPSLWLNYPEGMSVGPYGEIYTTEQVGNRIRKVEIIPAAPTNLSAQATISTQVNLSWTDASYNETGVVVERRTGTVGDYSQIASLAANITSYQDTTVSGGTTYYYRVRSVNGAGYSSYSNEVNIIPPLPPDAPSNLASSAVSYSQVNLSWTDNSSTETGFKIEVKIGAGTYALLATIGANQTAYSHTTASPSTTYTYRVYAYNAAGNSAYSNETTSTTPALPPPEAPSGLAATALSGTRISLSWTDNSPIETGFKIERKTGAGNFSQIASVGANVTSYTDVGLSFSTQYTYRVRAFNAVGDSAYSNESSATTTAGLALFVVGNTTLTAADLAVKNRLISLGFSVTAVSGASSATTDATGKTLVIISSTVSSTDVNTKFRDVGVPVLLWESTLYDDMKMTGTTSGTDYGTLTSQTSVTILNSSHPLAGGLSGTVTVVSSSGTFDWGKPGASANQIAKNGSSTNWVIFGYEGGSTMVGMNAPARRVGTFLYDTTASYLNTNGWTLFDAAVRWGSYLTP